MKTNNLEKRKNNILIATIITFLCFLLNALLVLVVRLLQIPLILKIILFSLLFLYLIFILPKLLLKLQDLIYNYLCKEIDIIEKNLSSSFVPIYLDTSVITDSALLLNTQREYFARLDNDGAIIIKILNHEYDKAYVEKTYDYEWFISVFRFKE